MYQAFGTQKRLTSKRKKLIKNIDNIIQSYTEAGMQITVRQVYYQCVSKNLIPNNANQYNKIVDLVADGRLHGLIDWAAIEDRTRYKRANAHWDSPEEIIQSAIESYKIDTRKTQPVYLEAWIEKDSLVSILEDTCRSLDVPCFSCRGNPSITALHEASIRFAEHQDKKCIILYAGDHDPSGLNIPQVIQERFNDFCVDVDLRRIGITLEQIKELDLPPFPAKTTDGNYKKYVMTTGLIDSWELDALPPETLSALFRDNILALTDSHLWKQELDRQKRDKNRLAEMLK